MGGGIFADQSVLEIGNNRISGNKAQLGGGVALMNSHFHMFGNTIDLNTADAPNASSTNMGGGLYLFDSKGTLENSTISNNLVSSGSLNPTLVLSNGNMAPGGGICIVFSKTVGTLNITGNTISTNTATGSQYYGGGIYCYQSSSTLTNNIGIRSNTINGNQALDGGGIALVHSSPTISDNYVSQNTAHWGGGLYGFSGTGIILNNTFDNNHAITIRPGVNSGGGGILCDEGYCPEIRGNLFSSNTAMDYGGGLEVYKAAAVIQENVFSGNQAQFGGGITVQDAGGKIERNYIEANQATTQSGGGLFISNTVLFSLRNNLIIGNSAAGYGGGISVFNKGLPEIINNTVVGNTAGIWGGGIHSYGNAFTITNNIIATNSDYGVFAENSSLSGDYNDVYGNGQEESYGMTEGIDSISLAPLFSNTRTYRLNANSPCANAGNPEASFNNPDGSRNHMGAYGGPLAGYIPAPGNSLSAPVLTVDIDGNKLVLSWTASSQADRYALYYAPYPDAGSIGSLDMGTKTTISTTLQSGTCFYVALKACGGTGESGYSNIEHFCIP